VLEFFTIKFEFYLTLKFLLKS